MFDTEAGRLCQILLDQQSVSPLLNLGSSTGQFRKVAKPHIQSRLFGPLEESGVQVVHCDLKQADGVDLALDILDPAAIDLLKPYGFRCILLSNLLEHVRDRQQTADRCEDIAGPGGLILVSVPSSFPYHADPIDTGYRPSPRDLAGLFRRSRCLLAEELAGRTYKEQLKLRGSPVWRALVATALWSLIAFARPRSAVSRVHRWFWYSRPYRVSIALFQVTETETRL